MAGGANLSLEPGHVRESLERLGLTTGDVVLVGHEIPTSAATEALRYARVAGALTIFNPAPAMGRLRDAALSDLLIPNQGEAAQLVGHEGDPEALAAELLGAIARGGHVLITLGPHGALLLGEDAPLTIPAPDVQAVDTVGAGDTLNGALAARLAAGLPLMEAAQRAVAAASLATTRAGAREGMPTARRLGSRSCPAWRAERSSASTPIAPTHAETMRSQRPPRSQRRGVQGAVAAGAALGGS